MPWMQEATIVEHSMGGNAQHIEKTRVSAWRQRLRAEAKDLLALCEKRPMPVDAVAFGATVPATHFYEVPIDTQGGTYNPQSRGYITTGSSTRGSAGAPAEMAAHPHSSREHHVLYGGIDELGGTGLGEDRSEEPTRPGHPREHTSGSHQGASDSKSAG